MRKEYLRNSYETAATDEMMKLAEADQPVKIKRWYGDDKEKYKTDIYIRCQIIEGILRVSFYMTRDMRMGNQKPAYELFIEKDTKKFFTWDVVSRKWRTATLEHMGWSFYGESLVWDISEEDNQLMKQYLGVTEDGRKGIISFQNSVRYEQLEKRHKRETDPWDLALSKVRPLPADWERWVDKHGIHYNYIFYDYSRKKKQTGYCTWCEKEVPIQAPRHNKMGKCPCCRHEIQYKAKGRAGWIQTIPETAYLLQPYGDGFIIRQFEVKRTYKKGGYKEPKRYIQEERRVIYNSKLESEVYHYGFYKKSYFRWIKGERIYHIFGIYSYDNRDYVGSIYRRNLPYLSRTKLSRTGLNEMHQELDRMDPEVYLEVLKKKAYLEELVKSGLIRVAKEVIDERRDLMIGESHDFAKSLGIDKNQMGRLRNNKGGFRYLAWLKYEKQNGKNYADSMLKQLEEWKLAPSDLGFILEKTSLVRICFYLKKQALLSGREEKELVSTWQDYLYMAARLKMDTELELIFKPKNLVEKHNEVVRLCGGLKLVEQAEEILKDFPDIDSICQSIKSK